MILNNVTVVDFNKRSIFLGDHGRLKSVLELSVRCLAKGANYTEIHNIISNISNQQFIGESFRSEITINGVNFGNGYVQSISAEPDGPDAQFKYYNLNIIIEYPGFLNKIFTSINTNDTKIIESLNENLSFSQEKSNKNFSHQVDIQINPDSRSTGLTVCKNLQNAISTDLNNIQKLINLSDSTYNFNKNVKTFPTIEYDSISCKYTYTDSWEKRDNSDGSEYPLNILASKIIRGDLAENGIIKITISLEAISNNTQLNFEEVKTFINVQKINLYNDANSFYQKIKGSSLSPLKNLPLSENYISSKNEFKYGITLVYTNDLNVNTSSKTISEITHSQTYEDITTIVSEEGTIYSFEVLNAINQEIDNGINNKYNGVLNAFKIDKPNIKTRCEDFVRTNILDNSIFKIIYYSESHSYNEGIIKYSYRYSNNPSLKYIDEKDTSTIFRKEVEEKNFEPDPIKLSSVFTKIGADEYQILQESLQSKNFKTISSKKISNVSSLKKFEEILSSLTVIPKTENSFVNEIEIGYSSTNREFTYSQSELEVRQ